MDYRMIMTDCTADSCSRQIFTNLPLHTS